MTTASIEAYTAIVDKLPGKRAIVWDYILNAASGATIRETRISLGWEHTTVSARIFELAEAGLIKSNGERGGQTVWVASRPDEVDALRAARKAAKRYETAIESFYTIPADGFGPEQPVYVTVKVPRRVWETIKSPARVRFL